MSDEFNNNEEIELNQMHPISENVNQEANSISLESENQPQNDYLRQNNDNPQSNENNPQQNSEISSNHNSSYSFWAEQVAVAASSPDSNNDQDGQNNQYGQGSQRNQDSQYGQSSQSNQNNQYGQENQSYFNNGIIEAQNPQSSYYSHEGAANSNVFDLPPNKNKKNPVIRFVRKAAKLIVIAAVFGMIAGAAFIGFNYGYYKINPNAASISAGIARLSDNWNLNLSDASDKKIAATTVSNNPIQQETDVSKVVEETMPSIVTITSTFSESYDWFGQEYDQENEGGGSGIIVGENDKELLIATNNHVVADSKSIKVNFIDNTQADAVIKGTDTIADLAVIAIDKSKIKKETLDAIKIAKLGDSKSVKVGQMAIAIGNALGYGQSVTVGYISAKDRKVTITDNAMVLLQTDAAINPGNSGGALLNLNGEVIGINSVKYASDEVEGMGYAIPISRAIPIINELMNREILKEDEKGYLGVYINDVTQEAADMYNWPLGVYITNTVDGGSADKAGIVAGDIITAVNDTKITAGKQLQEKITSYRVGTEVKLTVMRNKDGEFVKQVITVTLGKKPKDLENKN